MFVCLLQAAPLCGVHARVKQGCALLPSSCREQLHCVAQRLARLRVRACACPRIAVLPCYAASLATSPQEPSNPTIAPSQCCCAALWISLPCLQGRVRRHRCTAAGRHPLPRPGAQDQAPERLRRPLRRKCEAAAATAGPQPDSRQRGDAAPAMLQQVWCLPACPLPTSAYPFFTSFLACSPRAAGAAGPHPPGPHHHGAAAGQRRRRRRGRRRARCRAWHAPHAQHASHARHGRAAAAAHVGPWAACTGSWPTGTALPGCASSRPVVPGTAPLGGRAMCCSGLSSATPLGVCTSTYQCCRPHCQESLSSSCLRCLRSAGAAASHRPLSLCCAAPPTSVLTALIDHLPHAHCALLLHTRRFVVRCQACAKAAGPGGEKGGHDGTPVGAAGDEAPCHKARACRPCRAFSSPSPCLPAFEASSPGLSTANTTPLRPASRIALPHVCSEHSRQHVGVLHGRGAPSIQSLYPRRAPQRLPPCPASSIPADKRSARDKQQQRQRVGQWHPAAAAAAVAARRRRRRRACGG